MTRLSDIPVQAETGNLSAIDLGVVTAVLNQVRIALVEFLDSGIAAAIDLRAVPRMNAATYQHLKEALSTGEVTARVEAEATVEITETQYPGVWWLSHRNERGGIVTELIEITELPAILKSHTAEMRAGLQRLEQALAPPSPQDG